MNTDPLPHSGCYLLYFVLEKSVSLQVGKLGFFHFPAGRYIYVGRARKNLPARLRRHCRKEKKFRWHIDYLLDQAAEVSYEVFDFCEEGECMLSTSLSRMEEMSVVAEGFGSSDCMCTSHLYYCTKTNFYPPLRR